MIKILITVLLVLAGSITYADIPIGCSDCMAECPHDTRDLKPCDRECPLTCSKEQAKEWKILQAESLATDNCYICMAECPHDTKDLKPCDRGCPQVCNPKRMQEAFLRANGDAKLCESSKVLSPATPQKNR